MKFPRFHSTPRPRASKGFTLVEMLIVVTIISLLAALTLGGYTYAMNSSRRRLTTGSFEAIKLALERYNAEFAEYPQPANSNTMASFPPAQTSYDLSGAACLYQALTGDGFDQIKGVSSSSGAGSNSGGSSSGSDGKVEGATEVNNKMFVEIPQTIYTRNGSTYILIDGFGHPFQYIKAATPTTPTTGNNNNNTTPTTINSTYDLWSYAEDTVNTTQKSVNTQTNTNLSIKWIKNW